MAEDRASIRAGRAEMWEGCTLPARIYSLAKELKIDSKELVDICTRAGITGKGSALASLDDDEVARLKEFLGGKTRSCRRARSRGRLFRLRHRRGRPARARHTRESYIPPTGVTGKPPVLDAPKVEKPAELRKKPLGASAGHQAHRPRSAWRNCLPRRPNRRRPRSRLPNPRRKNPISNCPPM